LHSVKIPASILVIASVALSATSCGSSGAKNTQIEPVYNTETGRLKLLKYDANNNGTVDTWSYMDGRRVLRIEIDKDEDGRIERWDHYNDDQTIAKVGFSRENDGKEDAWWYAGADGAVIRIEISGHRDGKVSRTEFYTNDSLVRVEEDSDADNRIDKWETYEADRLTSVAFDTTHRGTPDRRLLYTPEGSVRVQVDVDGDGQFTNP
jgi:hypothetical protein